MMWYQVLKNLALSWLLTSLEDQAALNYHPPPRTPEHQEATPTRSTKPPQDTKEDNTPKDGIPRAQEGKQEEVKEATKARELKRVAKDGQGTMTMTTMTRGRLS
jgi:hypothetical protein